MSKIAAAGHRAGDRHLHMQACATASWARGGPSLRWG